MGTHLKRRKKTNANTPAKGRLKDMADQLWSISIRTDWQWKCAVCGNVPCEAHHLIPRQFTATRYDMQNGIALCASHHQFCPDISPHRNAAGWMEWLRTYHNGRYEWYVETVKNGDHRKFSGTKNAVYYCKTILSFRQYVEADKFRSIVGAKFSEYLIEKGR